MEEEAYGCKHEIGKAANQKRAEHHADYQGNGTRSILQTA